MLVVDFESFYVSRTFDFKVWNSAAHGETSEKSRLRGSTIVDD